MSFYRKYELDRLMTDGDAKTFRAVENASGRIVFLHLFNSRGLPLLAILKSHLIGVNGEATPPLIEIGEFAGSQYAVTEALNPFTNITDWIGTVLSNGVLPVEPEPVAVPVAVERVAEKIPAVQPPRIPEPVVTPQLLPEEPAEDFSDVDALLEPVLPASSGLRGATGTLDDLREISRDFEPLLTQPSRPKPTQVAPPLQVPIPAFATEKRSNSGMMALVSLVIVILAVLAIILLNAKGR